MVAGLAFGLILLLQEVGTLLHLHLPKVTAGHKAQQGQLTVVKDASKAGFDFLEPVAGSDWQFDAKKVVFDSSKGVVDYPVQLADGTTVTISQQPMPDDLKPYDKSAKFNQFISSSNVSLSEPVGQGKAYFVTALSNGAPANGATTAIYATDKILMFGQAREVLPLDKWAKLFAAMQAQSVAK